MRLLHVRTLELREFASDVPCYAIASHRWKGAAHEATIKDVRKKRNSSKSGYKKVECFAEYVRTHVPHVEWLWIDTCCVNQESSQEVTEAVNSMFRWYAEAEVCLAYLVDVSNAESELEFRRSEWFARGWTLQELLAPSVVIFLSCNWETIGYKGAEGWSKKGFRVSESSSLESKIASITSVPETVLHNYSRSESFSAEERLAWIQNRETTKAEDMSYSLLGVFGVAMPVIYGEGAQNARRRLLEEISKISPSTHGQPGLRIPPSTHPAVHLEPCAIMNFRRDPDYVSREDIMAQIDQKLSCPEAKIALVGLGGSGKSLLAIEYAHEMRTRRPDTWVLWLHASDAARLRQSVRTVVDRLGIPGSGDPKADEFKLFEGWLRERRNGRWLVLLDNADEPSLLGKRGLDFLPVCDHGSILFTTRSRYAATQLVDDADGDVVQIPPMDEQQAVRLLQKKLCRKDIAEDLIELARALECIPLAIAQAGSCIRQRAPRYSVRQYLEQLQKSEKSEISLLSRDEGNTRRDKEASNSILLTWGISFEHIRQIRPSAADVLSLMSFFDRHSVPEFLIKERATIGNMERKRQMKSGQGGAVDSGDDYSNEESSASEDSFDYDFEDDVHLLQGYSFIDITTDVAMFKMHRLVQRATQSWLETHDQLEHWKGQFILILNKTFPNGTYENWTTCQLIFPHVKAARRLKIEKPKLKLKYSALMCRAAWYACQRGAASEGADMARRSLKVRLKQLGENHKDTLQSKAMLAACRKEQGRLAEAEELDVSVMEGRQALLGPEHPSTLTSMANVASTYQDQGRWKEAGDLYTKVTEIQKSVIGLENSSTIINMANLASIYWNQGQLNKAEELELQVMHLRKTALGLQPEHPDMLQGISNLAKTYSQQGRWKESEDLETQVAETRRVILGPDHPDTLSSITDLASTYRQQGRWKEAEELDVKVLQTSQTVLGPDHPRTLQRMSNLALTYSSQKRWREAEELGLQVIESCRVKLGPDHPDTLSSMSNLASVYRNQERWKEAEELQLQVIDVNTRVLGADHPDTLTTMANLASTYADQGRLKKAEELEVQVLATSRAVLGSEHPDTLTSMINLASTYSSQGRWKEAEELEAQVVEMSETVLGPEHPDTLISIANLSITYENQGRQKEAEGLRARSRA